MKKTKYSYFIFLFIFSLASNSWSLFFSPPTNSDLERNADLIVKAKVLQVYSEEAYKDKYLGKQLLKVKIEKIYKSVYDDVKVGDKLKFKIIIMEARMPVFKKPLIERRVRGKSYLMFFYKSKSGYKLVYGPYGFLPWKEALKKRFSFLRQEKITRPKSKIFLDRIIFENTEFLH